MENVALKDKILKSNSVIHNNKLLNDILNNTLIVADKRINGTGGTDLNTITETGCYEIEWIGRAINAPEVRSDGAWGILLVVRGNGSYILQVLFDFQSGNIDFRGYYDNTRWIDWAIYKPADKEIIYEGALKGGESITLTKHKRFLDIYANTFHQTLKYTMDTSIKTNNGNSHASATSLACDSGNYDEYYISVASLKDNEFTHRDVGYMNLFTHQLIARNNNVDYVIYRIETYD